MAAGTLIVTGDDQPHTMARLNVATLDFKAEPLPALPRGELGEALVRQLSRSMGGSQGRCGSGRNDARFDQQ
jgi:hypothetical protein